MATLAIEKIRVKFKKDVIVFGELTDRLNIFTNVKNMKNIAAKERLRGRK